MRSLSSVLICLAFPVFARGVDGAAERSSNGGSGSTLLPPHSSGRATLGILGIFKNEAQVMAEWVRHYVAEGVTQIVLINDNSTDGGDDIARSLGVTVVPSIGAGQQILNYMYYAPSLTTEWQLIADLDEFAYARPVIESENSKGPQPTLASYLEAHSSTTCGSIAVPWTMFGSTNSSRHPVSLIGASEYRMSSDRITNINVKTIARRADLCALGRYDRPDFVSSVSTHWVAVSSSYCFSAHPPSQTRTDARASRKSDRHRAVSVRRHRSSQRQGAHVLVRRVRICHRPRELHGQRERRRKIAIFDARVVQFHGARPRP